MSGSGAEKAAYANNSTFSFIGRMTFAVHADMAGEMIFGRACRNDGGTRQPTQK